MKTKIDQTMLEIMNMPDTKKAGILVHLTLKDGSKRTGIYKDVMPDPLNRVEFKDQQFIKFEAKKDGMISYLPLSQIDIIEWSY